MSDKLKAAIEKLGTNWILHPQSTFDVRRWKIKAAVTLDVIRYKGFLEGRL